MSYYQQGRGELLADHTEGCRVQKADIIMLNATYNYKPMHTSICTQTLCTCTMAYGLHRLKSQLLYKKLHCLIQIRRYWNGIMNAMHHECYGKALSYKKNLFQQFSNVCLERPWELV